MSGFLCCGCLAEDMLFPQLKSPNLIRGWQTSATLKDYSKLPFTNCQVKLWMKSACTTAAMLMRSLLQLSSVYFRLCCFQPFSHLVWIWHPVAILSYPVIIFSKMVYTVLTGMTPSRPYFSSVEKCYANNDREKQNVLLVLNYWHESLCIWTICLHKIE